MLRPVGPGEYPPPPPGGRHRRRPSRPVRRGGATTGVLGIHVSHGGVRAAPRAVRVRLRGGGRRRRRRIARGGPRGQPAWGLAQYHDDGAGAHRRANGGGRAGVRAREGAFPGGPGAGQPAVFGAAVYEV